MIPLARAICVVSRAVRENWLLAYPGDREALRQAIVNEIEDAIREDRERRDVPGL